MGIRWGVVVTLLVLAGCGDRGSHAPSGRADHPDLDGTSWVATSITEGGRDRPLVDGTTLRVDFSHGEIAIDAGCNHLSGSYRFADGGLTVHALAGTDMGCTQALMDQDAWLSGTVFGSPLAVTLSGDTLTLERGDLRLDLRDRRVALPDAHLQGTTWLLDGMGEGSSMSSLPQGARTPTLRIAADGSVRLHTGCNGGGGTATFHGKTLSLGPVVTTRMACADPAGQDVERTVLQVLDGDVTWSISERTLTLRKGGLALVWRAAR